MRRVTRTRRPVVREEGMSLPSSTSPATDTGPRARVRKILDNCVGADLSSWEKFEFLPSVANRFVLTEKQEQILAGIEERVL